ncbi:Uncharacterised protein [Halioglobus japonicus]|nr:Uncharacterised protein [Halioglobus japonicus]
MSRKERQRNIAELHQRLAARNQKLVHAQARTQAQLQTLSPVLLLGAGLAAGALVHRIGWHSAYSLLALASRYLMDTGAPDPFSND